MRIESKLCHLTEKKAIVKVNGWLDEKKLGSALAEGPTVEVAEDKAISRLNKRINGVPNSEAVTNLVQEDKTINPSKNELPKSEKINLNNEPSDWSNELTAIDLELKRLNWSRDDEINFLVKTLGYNNRSKITKYNDIVKYLCLLKNKDNQKQLVELNSNINNLIEESDAILSDLSWDHIRGREYLQKEFNVSTRKELSEKQLISFVKKLKSIQN